MIKPYLLSKGGRCKKYFSHRSMLHIICVNIGYGQLLCLRVIRPKKTGDL